MYSVMMEVKMHLSNIMEVSTQNKLCLLVYTCIVFDII
jgi:hypothetical protein